MLLSQLRHTQVTEKGEIKYSKVVRENVRKLEAYVEEMASGDTVSGAVDGFLLQATLSRTTMEKL